VGTPLVSFVVLVQGLPQCFYAMHRALRLRNALLATVHHPHFANLDIVKKNNRVMLAVLDIKNDQFWHVLYILLQSVYPALLSLRYTGANKPSMCKLFYLAHQVTKVLQISRDPVNDESVFSSFEDDGGVGFETEEVFGSDELSTSVEIVEENSGVDEDSE